jgi:hypothetical protein
MHLSFNNSDKKLVFAFIAFSLTFFVAAMIALFIVIYASDANGIFRINQPPSINQLRSQIRLSPIKEDERGKEIFYDIQYNGIQYRGF